MTANDLLQSITPRRSPRISIPGLTIFNGVRFVILLIPIWYVLGVDQFVLPFIFILLFLFLVAQRVRQGRGIIVTKFARICILFICAQIFSGLFVIESDLYIVYIRNVLAWGSSILLLIVLTNVITSRAHIVKLLWSWVYLLLFACILGALSFFLREGFEFKTAALYIVPAGMRDGVTAETVWTRSFLAEGVLIGDQNWFRARSFFLYANSYAGILAISVPLIAYLLHMVRKFSVRWWLIWGTLCLCVLNLVITTSRAAILGLLFGSVFWLFSRTRRSDKILWFLLILLIIGLGLSLLLINPKFIDSVTVYLQEFTTAKGSSHITRLNVLKYSIISWQERPLFGWGTPREMALYGFSTRYPRLGSHSQFLSVLYRNGIVGMIIFVWLLITLWRLLHQVPSGDWRNIFRSFLAWAFLANLAQSIFTQLDIELMLLFFVWQLWAMIDVLPRLSQPSST